MDTTMNATTASVCPHNSTAHDGTLLCHWANSPGARGTLNIFWLCTSTLGLCVWNAVHPDVPRPKTPGWRVFGMRLWWLFVGLFMPEMLVLVALGQLRLSWELLVDIDHKGHAPTQFPWWMYLFKAWSPTQKNIEYEAKWYMRALLWCFPPVPDRNEVGGREYRWTLTHSFYAVMGGFVDEDGHAIPATVHFFNRDKTVSHRIKLPFDDPERVPDVSVDDIEDRGKAGALAKSFLVWQLFVFLENCFARWDQSLPLSLLEITTIGHSLCSIIAMVLWWYKPHSIGEATVINRQGPLPSLSNVEWIKVFSWSFLADSLRQGSGKVLSMGSDSKAMDAPKTVTIAAIAVLYGLPHLFGLSVHFPTFAEQLCWTVATFTVIASPLVMCGILWILPYIHYRVHIRVRDAVKKSLFYLLIILLVVYPISSMFLVGESVRQIFALPVESFREPQQTTYLPSFS